MSNLPSNLTTLREGKGMSGEQLSQLSGVSRSHIWKIERSESSPTLDTIERLAKALDVSIGELIDGLGGDAILIPKEGLYARAAKACGEIVRRQSEEAWYHKQWLIHEVLRILVGDAEYARQKKIAEKAGLKWDEGVEP